MQEQKQPFMLHSIGLLEPDNEGEHYFVHLDIERKITNAGFSNLLSVVLYTVSAITRGSVACPCRHHL